MQRNIYQKLTAFFAAFMLFGGLPMSIYGAEEASADYINPIKVVTSLGIMENSLSGDFDIDSPVTKADFSKILLNALSIDYSHYEDNRIFADVSPDNPDIGAVSYAFNLGIIAGDESGFVEPDMNINYTQAVKMAVSAMGYGSLAEMSGGYPVGYIKISETYLDLHIKNYDTPFTRGCAALMIYEILDAPLMKITGYDASDPVYAYGSKSDTTLLNQAGFDVYNGIMTSTPFETTVALEGFCDEGYVAVSGKSFKVPDDEVYSCFACDVEVYYPLKNSNAAVCVVPCSETGVTYIKSENINRSKTNESVIVHFDDEEERRLRLKNPVMIYNGEGILFNSELMFGVSGIVKVIENDNSGFCAVVVCDNENTIAAGVDYDNTIYFKTPVFGETFSVSEQDGLICVTGSDGEILSPSEIEPGNVLSVRRSKTNSVVHIVVCNNSIEAKVQKTNDKLEVDGVEYTALCDISKINTRDTYTLYLNYLGQVCYAEAETNVNKYGYILSAGLKNDLGSKLIFRIFRTNGSITDYECAPKVKFNGIAVDVTDNGYAQGILRSLEETAISQINGEKYQQIIKFTSDSEGYINSIITSGSENTDDSLELSFEYEERKYRKETECFGDFFVGHESVVFNIPFNADRQTAGNMSVASGLRFANEETYSTVVYDCDDTFVAGVIVNYTGTVQGGISIDTHVAVFDKVSPIVDSNGENAQKIYVYELGKEKSYIVREDSGVDLTAYSRGDLVKLLVSDGECVSAECDLDIISESEPPEDFQNKEGAYSSASYTSGISHMAQMRKVFGRIIAFREGRIVVEAKTPEPDSKLLAKASGFGSITVCDFKKDDIYSIPSSLLGAYTEAVNPDARVFVHMRYGAPMSMVLYVFK